MATATTERQREVLDLIRQKKTPTEIADALGISYNGVQSHIRRLRKRGLIPRGYGHRSSNGARRTRTRNPETTVASSDSGDSRATSLDGVPSLGKAVSELVGRIGTLNEERESIDARYAELDAERKALAEREEAIKAERARLALVHDGIMEAVK